MLELLVVARDAAPFYEYNCPSVVEEYRGPKWPARVIGFEPGLADDTPGLTRDAPGVATDSPGANPGHPGGSYGLPGG
jgi:hypothetical protein